MQPRSAASTSFGYLGVQRTTLNFGQFPMVVLDEGLTTDVRISLTRKRTTASKKAVVKQKVVTK